MKKLFIWVTLLTLILSLSLTAYAAESEPDAETTPLEIVTTAPMEEPQEPALTTPTEDEVQGGITDIVDKLDQSLSGIEIWETAKTWILDNLSMLVGIIMAIITAIVGLATKFSFIPKIISYVKTLAAAIGKWYDDNTAELKELITSFASLKTSLQNYLAQEVKPLVEKVEQQSQENERLRQENNQLYREYIKARAQTNRIEGALLEYSRLAAEEFEDLIQSSDLTKADLDKHYESYRTKVALIEAVCAADEAAEGSDVA